ncbi:MAG TPA: DUF5678 domain-containing protein [Blastocatellia bacterium]|nr:DUF5678 domain-containing protein [Blastocatellia bacterium]
MGQKALPQVRKASRPYIDRSRELAWLAAHREEYAGQWVVLEGNRLVGHGDNPMPIVDKARAEGIECPFVIHVRAESGPFIGGFAVSYSR